MGTVCKITNLNHFLNKVFFFGGVDSLPTLGEETGNRWVPEKDGPGGSVSVIHCSIVTPLLHPKTNQHRLKIDGSGK